MSKIAEYDYYLPDDRVAQTPLSARDASRLLVLHRVTAEISHHSFSQIADFFQPGDVLVVNNSRVLPARLFGHKIDTGGSVELLLLEKIGQYDWQVLVGGKRIVQGLHLEIQARDGSDSGIVAQVIGEYANGVRVVRFSESLENHLGSLGHVPLPPYVRETLDDPERYQTVYSRPLGSAAAPTAGLHFTPEILLALRERGVSLVELTLHVGLDTFKPIKSESIEDHVIHSEWSELSSDSARRINEAKLAGKRIVAVGTTAVRVLETAALRSAGYIGSLSQASDTNSSFDDFSVCAWRPVTAYEGKTDLYIYPGFQFRVVDAMITNFHLPQTSLLLLVSAFASWAQIKGAYQTAIDESYRFYSFGDAMLIL